MNDSVLVHKLDELHFLLRSTGSETSRPSFFLWSQCHLYTWHSLSPSLCETFFMYSLVQLLFFLYSYSSILIYSLFFLCLRLMSLLLPHSSLDFLRRAATQSLRLSKSRESDFASRFNPEKLSFVYCFFYNGMSFN